MRPMRVDRHAVGRSAAGDQWFAQHTEFAGAQAEFAHEGNVVPVRMTRKIKSVRILKLNVMIKNLLRRLRVPQSANLADRVNRRQNSQRMNIALHSASRKLM